MVAKRLSNELLQVNLHQVSGGGLSSGMSAFGDAMAGLGRRLEQISEDTKRRQIEAERPNQAATLNAADRFRARLMTTHPDDPDAIAASWQHYVDGVMQTYEGKATADETRQKLLNGGAVAEIGAIEKRAIRARQEEQSAIGARYDGISDNLAELAANGLLDTEHAANLRDEGAEHLSTMVAKGFITQAEAEKALQGTQHRLLSVTLETEAMQVYEEEGYVAAARLIENGARGLEGVSPEDQDKIAQRPQQALAQRFQLDEFERRTIEAKQAEASSIAVLELLGEIEIRGLNGAPMNDLVNRLNALRPIDRIRARTALSVAGIKSSNDKLEADQRRVLAGERLKILNGQQTENGFRRFMEENQWALNNFPEQVLGMLSQTQTRSAAELDAEQDYNRLFYEGELDDLLADGADEAALSAFLTNARYDLPLLDVMKLSNRVSKAASERRGAAADDTLQKVLFEAGRRADAGSLSNQEIAQLEEAYPELITEQRGAWAAIVDKTTGNARAAVTERTAIDQALLDGDLDNLLARDASEEELSAFLARANERLPIVAAIKMGNKVQAELNKRNAAMDDGVLENILFEAGQRADAGMMTLEEAAEITDLFPDLVTKHRAAWSGIVKKINDDLRTAQKEADKQTAMVERIGSAITLGTMMVNSAENREDLESFIQLRRDAAELETDPGLKADLLAHHTPGNPASVATIGEMILQTGLWPASVVEKLVAYQTSTDMNDIIWAAGLIAEIDKERDRGGVVLGRLDNQLRGFWTRHADVVTNGNTEYLAEIHQRILEETFPTVQSRTEERVAAIALTLEDRREIAKLVPRDRKLSDPRGVAEVPETYFADVEMMLNELLPVFGNDRAKALAEATRSTNNVWGTTRFGGTLKMERFPIEKFFAHPQIRDVNWAEDLLARELAKASSSGLWSATTFGENPTALTMKERLQDGTITVEPKLGQSNHGPWSATKPVYEVSILDSETGAMKRRFEWAPDWHSPLNFHRVLLEEAIGKTNRLATEGDWLSRTDRGAGRNEDISSTYEGMRKTGVNGFNIILDKEDEAIREMLYPTSRRGQTPLPFFNLQAETTRQWLNEALGVTLR